MYEHGHAVRREIQTGVSDGQWIEVTGRRGSHPEADPLDTESWVPFDGSERVIISDPSLLAEDMPVQVAPARGEEKVARRTSPTPAP
jgi:hypothetical protein